MDSNSKLKTFVKAFKVSLKNRKKLSIVVNVIGLFMALIPSVTAVVLQKMTDSINLLMDRKIEPGSVIWTFGLLVSLFLLQVIYDSLKDFTQNVDSNITMVKYIKKRILQSKCEVHYKYIENYDNYYDKVSFAETQSGLEVAASFKNIICIFQDTITFVSIVILLGKVNPCIVIALLVTSIPATIISYLQKDEAYYKHAKWMKENNLVLFYYYVISAEENAQEIRHNGLFKYMKGRWREFADNYIGKKKKLTMKHVIYNSIADFLRSAVYIFIILVTVHKIYLNHEVGIGTFVLVYSLSERMQTITARLFTSIVQLYASVPYMEDFFYLDEMEKDQGDSNKPIAQDGDIKFDHVYFRYPGTNEDTLKDINLTIKKGEKVVIVGQNGSGKSTFVSLLCGMMEPDKGQIVFGDLRINEHIAEIRNSISVVFQDFGHYQDTLRNNITISNKKRVAVDQEIMNTAKSIEVDEIIHQQAKGLDEELGSFNKDYKDLSGGQWQKLAIARAIYRNDANVMVLDEPTSALDPIAEAQIYRNFSELTGGKTTLLISHRLGIASVADRILVFNQGKIVEDGNHKELMSKNGYYAKMYVAQAKWYQEGFLMRGRKNESI